MRRTHPLSLPKTRTSFKAFLCRLAFPPSRPLPPPLISGNLLIYFPSRSPSCEEGEEYGTSFSVLVAPAGGDFIGSKSFVSKMFLRRIRAPKGGRKRSEEEEGGIEWKAGEEKVRKEGEGKTFYIIFCLARFSTCSFLLGRTE